MAGEHTHPPSQPFTVIAWATASYEHLATGLRSDCERFGYPFHLYEIDDDYASLMRAWCNHPLIIRRGVEDFGSVLFLDVECRIVAPIPEGWRAPLVSVRRPAQKFWIRYNTGTVMADASCLPWLEAWLRVIEDWKLGDLAPEDHVHWPGDLCDEVGLAAALAVLGVRVATPELEYIDRTSRAEIARGLWRNEHTIIQHPTVHHWPKEADPVECKKLFVQNYAADPALASTLFTTASGTPASAPPEEHHGWIFDPARRLYAPAEYWQRAPRPWTDEAVTLTSAQR